MQAFGLDPSRQSMLREYIPDGIVALVVAKDREADARAKAALELLALTAEREMRFTFDLRLASALSARHVENDERDRLLLSTKIHNDLSQSATLIRLGLASMKRQLTEADSERILNDVDDLVEAARQMSESVIAISNNLRPPMIETLGPVMALRQEAKRYQASTGIAVECELEEIPLEPKAALAVFRIAQESLLNIAQHAGASNVRIHLTREDSSVILEIYDNGRGFDLAEMQLSLGLAGMAERASIADGSLRIDTSPGQGTMVRAIFPIPPNSQYEGDQ